MIKNCFQCGISFTLTDADKAFLQQIDVPEPSQCPECRNLRRLSHINDSILYNRPCDHCGKSFVSTIPLPSAYTVICNHCWYLDSRNDKEHGRDYDPARPFF